MSFFSNLKASVGHYSTMALSAAFAFPAIWAANPDLHILVPADKMAYVTAGIALLGIVGKGVQQGGPTVQLPKSPDAPETADVIKAVVEQQGAKFVKDLLKKALQ